MSPLYSMNPRSRNLFMKKLTRERVVPTISASVSCDIFGIRQRLVRLAVARQQEQDAREPLFARVEQLIDEVLLDADVPRQHVREEPLGQRRLRVQHLEHLRLLDDQHRARAHRRRGRDAPRLPRETPLAKEVTLAQDRHDRLFAGPREHRQLDAALLDVEHVGGGVALARR